ncbi:hypothetical protein O7598_16955 [Micromonospora sp. WMMC241]|uniref:hypothetical protein n=1 Tax=Micromonospora sp. WMMC241 TaxID=3015159 RepID=UPI0022B6490F|nr:hypothetical protein [Micromonospora sp. WMMC241]MCZ7438102.1 hypothetical protein [Micromonospora sp. WMMC241]
MKSERGTLILLVAAVAVGLASLVLALLDPSRIGSWATAVGMTFVAGAQVARLRELRKRDR